MLPGFYRAIDSPHLTCGHTAAPGRLPTSAWSNALLCAVGAALRTKDSSFSLILHLFPKPQLPFHALTTTYLITMHPALQKKPQWYSPWGTSAECSLKSWMWGSAPHLGKPYSSMNMQHQDGMSGNTLCNSAASLSAYIGMLQSHTEIRKKFWVLRINSVIPLLPLLLLSLVHTVLFLN